MKGFYYAILFALWFNYQGLCAGFVQNVGQYPHIAATAEASFIVHLAPGILAHIHSKGINYHYSGLSTSAKACESGKSSQLLTPSFFSIRWLGASYSRVITEEIGPKFHYYYSHGTFINVPSYQKITYSDVYPGIDLVFTIQPLGEKSLLKYRLKYDWYLRAGAKLEDIQIQLPFTPSLDVQHPKFVLIQGDAVLEESIPRSYLLSQESQIPTRVYYQSKGNIVSFVAPERSINQALVIDPLIYAYRYGGVDNDLSYDIATWQDGSFVVVGATQSFNLFTQAPQSASFLSGFNSGNTDMFIFKANSQGKAEWVTYYGGSNEDVATTVAFDNNGDIIVAGNTNSLDFPRTFSPVHYRQDYLNQEVAILKFSALGVRKFGFLYGGSEKEVVNDIAVSPTNEIVIGGATASNNLPTLTISPQQYFQFFSQDVQDGYLAKFDENGALLWGTYLGGNGIDEITGIAVDPDGNIGICGQTQASNFPTTSNPNQYRQSFQGEQDAFVVLLSSLGVRQWSLLYGGEQREWMAAHSIVCNARKEWIIAGTTASINLPFAENTYAGGTQDIFVAAFSSSGQLQKAFYYGGNRADNATGVVIDRLNNIAITGFTRSINFPVTNLELQYSQSFQSTNEEALVIQLDSLLRVRMAFLYGGIDNDRGYAIAPKGATGVIITGQTNSIILPTTNFDWHYNQEPKEEKDAFIAYFEGPPAIARCSPLLINEVAAGNTQPFIELLVNGCPGTHQDLRDFIIDDNSGRGNTCSLPQTITSGHIRLKNISNWQRVPVGSLIVIYHSAFPPTGITPDPTDANQDRVYFVAANDTNFLDIYSQYPAPGNCDYYFPVGIKNQSSGFSTLDFSLAADLVQVVSPQTLEVLHAVAWNLPPTGMPVRISNSMLEGSSLQFTNRLDNDAFVAANWQMATPSPGMANSAENGQYIAFLKSTFSSIPLPPPPTVCSVGDSASIVLPNPSPFMEYRWSPALGLSSSLGTAIKAKPAQTTVYTIEAIPRVARWTNCGNCPRIQASLLVNVIPSPPAPQIFANDPICENSSLILSASNLGNVQYLWQGPQGFVATSRFARVPSVAPASIYSVVAIRENCTSAVSTYSPSVVAAPMVVPTITPASFRWGRDGKIELFIATPYEPVTIIWRDSQNQIVGEESTLSGVLPGRYTVTVTNFIGCTQTRTFEIPFTPSLSVELITLKPLLCVGDKDGAISARAINGQPPYRYEWSGTNGFQGQGPIITGLSAGTYFLRVTDSQGAQVYYQTTLQEPTPPLAKLITLEPVTCSGRKDGILVVSLEGGRAPYNFRWQDTSLLSLSRRNLAPGRYTIEVVDDNNCKATYHFVVSEVPPLQQASAQILFPRCDTLGQICLNIQGGTLPYNYIWSDGFTGITQVGDCIGRQGLRGGVYSLRVIDRNGCSQNWVYTLPQATALRPILLQKSNTVCAQASNGMIELSAIGGTPPYTFIWQDGKRTAKREDLRAGSYDVIVSDAQGCQATLRVEVAVQSNPIKPEVRVINQRNVSCTGAANGSILLEAKFLGSVSSPEFEYTLDGNAWQSNPLFDVPAGVYKAKVKLKDLGCESDWLSPIAIEEPVGVVFTELRANSAHTLIATWQNLSGTSQLVLQYRIVGQSSWNTVEGISQSSYLLTNLQPNTEYEVRIGAKCNQGVTHWSTSLRQRTQGEPSTNCNIPRGFYIVDRQINSAQLRWNSVAGAVCYGVNYAENTTPLLWKEEWTPTNSYELRNLRADREYIVRIRANCSFCQSSGILSSYSTILTIPAWDFSKISSFLEDSTLRVSLFPNPIKQRAFLSCQNGGEIINARIFSSEGREIGSWIFSSEDFIEIDFSSWPSSVYYLIVQSGDKVRWARIIKIE
ncbi:MAG: SBBP repeat-containing protein [Bacteroidia bacterium]|nr:SBBP repeat-containing protein [Bacteroidia bacterium]MDW8159662.1 SBBP repeat-containing protein [Bacteroidia bacterium]